MILKTLFFNNHKLGMYWNRVKNTIVDVVLKPLEIKNGLIQKNACTVTGFDLICNMTHSAILWNLGFKIWKLSKI